MDAALEPFEAVGRRSGGSAPATRDLAVGAAARPRPGAPGRGAGRSAGVVLHRAGWRAASGCCVGGASASRLAAASRSESAAGAHVMLRVLTTWLPWRDGRAARCLPGRRRAGSPLIGGGGATGTPARDDASCPDGLARRGAAGRRSRSACRRWWRRRWRRTCAIWAVTCMPRIASTLRRSMPTASSARLRSRWRWPQRDVEHVEGLERDLDVLQGRDVERGHDDALVGLVERGQRSGRRRPAAVSTTTKSKPSLSVRRIRDTSIGVTRSRTSGRSGRGQHHQRVLVAGRAGPRASAGRERPRSRWPARSSASGRAAW